MEIVLLVSVVSILLAFLESIGKAKYGLVSAFVILTIVFAFRFDFGNDYMGYFSNFQKYLTYTGSLFDFKSLKELHSHGEYGWVFLNMIFRPIGFFGFVIVLTIFENVIIYDFIKTYVPVKWYPLALFIFAINPYLMVLGASMMRQWLTICLFVYSFRFIVKRQIIRYYVVILAAITIHSTAVLLLPFYFITYLKNVKLTYKSLFWFLPLLFLWYVFSPELFAPVLLNLLSSEQYGMYDMYSGGSGEQYGILGMIAALLYPVICISQSNNVEENERLLIFLYFFSILIRPLGLVLGMVSRLSFYFDIFALASFPIVMRKIKELNTIWVILLLVVICVPTIRDFFAFFNATTWIDKFGHYQTIFGQPWQ